MQNRQSNNYLSKPGALSKSEYSQLNHTPNSNSKRRTYAEQLDRDQPIVSSLFTSNQEALQ